MDWKQRYETAQPKLLNDPEVCAENRALFAQFFAYEEYKLKRSNGNQALDANSYKTLLAYVSRLRVVNRWFANKPWVTLQKADIQKVYDELEDGKITTRFGRPVQDRKTYYNLVLRSKPFEMAGKKELFKEVMQFSSARPKEAVRFIREESFRRLVEVAQKIDHRLLLWLCWDIGENARALLQLRKRDCVRQVDEQTSEVEYLINLPRDILKRSRRPRSELTNYKETVHFLDVHLPTLRDDEPLFTHGEGWAVKILARSVAKTNVRCLPGGQRPSLKDLRSSMACDLLSKGWSRDEVNARLGHSPSSGEIDRYVNYLAIDRTKPKQKFQESQVGKLSKEVVRLESAYKGVSHELVRFKHDSARRVAMLSRMVGTQSDMLATLLSCPIQIPQQGSAHRRLQQGLAVLQEQQTIWEAYAAAENEIG